MQKYHCEIEQWTDMTLLKIVLHAWWKQIWIEKVWPRFVMTGGGQTRNYIPVIGVDHKIHYINVIMSVMTSQITGVSTVYSTVVQAQIKENIKTPRH